MAQLFDAGLQSSGPPSRKLTEALRINDRGTIRAAIAEVERSLYVEACAR